MFNVYQGDSRILLKELADNSVDLILTDPPYNVGMHATDIALKDRTDINLRIADWDNQPFEPSEWAGEFIRVLKKTGNIFVFTGHNLFGKWYDALDPQFDKSNFFVWCKSNTPFQVFKVSFRSSAELVFCAWNKGHTWNYQEHNEMRNYMETPMCMGTERLKEPHHPTQKPVKVMERLVKIASNPGDVVLDPFMGVGSTGVAAVGLDRKFIGMELDEAYFNAAKYRIGNTGHRLF